MLVTAYSIYLIFEAAAFRILGETTEWALNFIFLPVERNTKFHPYHGHLS